MVCPTMIYWSYFFQFTGIERSVDKVVARSIELMNLVDMVSLFV